MTKAVFKDALFAVSGLCCVGFSLYDRERANPIVTFLLLTAGFVFQFVADAGQKRRTAEEKRRREETGEEEVGPFTYLLK